MSDFLSLAKLAGSAGTDVVLVLAAFVFTLKLVRELRRSPDS